MPIDWTNQTNCVDGNFAKIIEIILLGIKILKETCKLFNEIWSQLAL